MHLLLTIAAGLITLSVLLMGWAMFSAKPDPDEEDSRLKSLRDQDIYDLHPSDRSKLKKVK
jgi:hypothetical protein